MKMEIMIGNVAAGVVISHLVQVIKFFVNLTNKQMPESVYGYITAGLCVLVFALVTFAPLLGWNEDIIAQYLGAADNILVSLLGLAVGLVSAFGSHSLQRVKAT